MPRNVTQKLLASHMMEGDPVPGREIAIAIDHTFTQDATGLGVDRAAMQISAHYVGRINALREHRERGPS